MPRTAGPREIIHSSESSGVGVIDCFAITRWYGVGTEDDMRAVSQAYRIALSRFRTGVGAIVVVDPTCGIPTPEARVLGAEMSKSLAQHTRASAKAVLGDGFWASAFRGIMTALQVSKRDPYPSKIFRHEADAIDWVVTMMGEPVEVYRNPLLEALAAMRAPSTPKTSTHS